MRLRRPACIASVALAAFGLAGAGSVWTAGRAVSAGTTTTAPVPSAVVHSHPVIAVRATVRRAAPAVAHHITSVPLEKAVTVASSAPPTTAPSAGLPDGSMSAAMAPQPGLATLGRIDIPSIGLDQPLYDGIAQYFIDAGPTYWPGTALPGAPGNMVIAGHRTTHTHPFYAIANMHPGDLIIIHTNAGATFTYRMDQQFVVPNTALWIKDPLPGSQMTIFTCHPIGSSSERLVTRATLVASS